MAEHTDEYLGDGVYASVENSRGASMRVPQYVLSAEDKAGKDTLIEWADKIDSRLGPIPGRDADALARLLRATAACIQQLVTDRDDQDRALRDAVGETARTADELAFWKYQAIWGRAYLLQPAAINQPFMEDGSVWREAACHLCCRSDVITLLPDEGDDLAIYEHEWIELPHGRAAVVKKGADGNCIYLGPEGCTIHDRAPTICRVFDCRRWYLHHTRAERKMLVKSGMADKAVFDAGRARLASLESNRLSSAQRATSDGR